MKFNDVELVIFDLDYTLIDSSAGIVFCFNQARRRAGEAEVAAEKIKPWIGQPIEETFRFHGSQAPQAMRDRFRKIAVDGAMAERSFLLPGVAETIPQLKQSGLRLAVASTKSRAEIQAILKKLRLAEFFEEVCGSDEVAKAKPAPDPLLAVMARLKVPPEKSVYVGDHLVDIQAARSAGTRIIAVTGYGGPCSLSEIQAAKPDAFISGLPELLGLIHS